MSEIDPVILELRAELGKYRAELQSTTSLVTQSLGSQENSAKRLEAQMLKSSGAISASIRSMAGTLAAAFSVREIVAMGDSWSDLSSQVGVAIKDMERAPEIMGRIAEAAKASYSPLEQTATQFARNHQTLSQLGYTVNDTLKFVEAYNNALVTTATRGDRARQVQDSLSKAIATGKLEAEGLDNILAHGGAIAEALAKNFGVTTNQLYRLRKEGKITGDVIVKSLIANFDELRAKAEEMPATVEDGFVRLKNELIRYIGETDKALGATERLATALIALGDNVDKIGDIIPVLASIIALIGVKYVAAAARAAAANVALSASAVGAAGAMGGMGATAFALQARMIGAATSMEAAAFAARGLGGSLIALAGGPYGAIIALGAGLAYVMATTNDAAKASDKYARQQEALKQIQEKTTDATDRLASATGKARAEALANAKALREETKQYLANAQAALIAAEAKAIQTRENARNAAQLASGAGPGEGVQGRISNSQAKFNRARKEAIQASEDARVAEQNVITAQNEVARLTKLIDGAEPPKIAATDEKKKKTKKPREQRDRTEQQTARAEQQLLSLQMEELRARADSTGVISERADFERDILRMEREARIAEIDANLAEIKKRKDVTDEGKRLAEKSANAQKAVIDSLYGREAVTNKEGEILVTGLPSLYGRMISLKEQADLLRRQNDMIRDETDAMSAEADLVQNRRARVALERQILDNQEAIARNALEERIITEKIGAAQADRLRALLERGIAANRAGFERSNASPLEQYREEIDRVGANLNDEFETIAANGLKNLNNGLTDAIMNSKNLGDAFKNVAKQIIADLIRVAIQQTVVNGLMSAFGGGSNFLGSIFGQPKRIPGRASGGYVAPGQVVRVNEHRGGAEYLRMGSQGGTVIPLGQVNAQAAQPATGGNQVVTVRLDLSGDIDARIQQQSAGVAIEVVRTSAPAIVDASANEALRRAGRPKL